MFIERLPEFFEVNGVFAMRNLTIFITIVVTSFIVVWLALIDKLPSEMFATYVLAGGGVYSFGKWQDSVTTRSKKK